MSYGLQFGYFLLNHQNVIPFLFNKVLVTVDATFSKRKHGRPGDLGVYLGCILALCNEYAHGNNFPWDVDTCSNAAANGHVEILQYARENSCPWELWDVIDA